MSTGLITANFHSGKLSVDWNGQENFSLSCELWVGTTDFNTCKEKFSCPFQSPDHFPEWKLAFNENAIPRVAEQSFQIKSD
jgi:hypothetical protein